MKSSMSIALGEVQTNNVWAWAMSRVYKCVSMYKGWLQKIKTENIMNFDQRVGRSRSQITIFNRAEIMARVYNGVNKKKIAFLLQR